MSSESNIFTREHQAYEQGQIPSNNCNQSPLSPRGSAQNGDHSEYTSISNHPPTKSQPRPKPLYEKSAVYLQEKETMLADTRDRERDRGIFGGNGHGYGGNWAIDGVIGRDRRHGYGEMEAGGWGYGGYDESHDIVYSGNSYNLNNNTGSKPPRHFHQEKATNSWQQGPATPNYGYQYYNFQTNTHQSQFKQSAQPYEYPHRIAENTETRQSANYGTISQYDQKMKQKQMNETQYKIEEIQAKISARESIDGHRKYFRGGDWQHLLYIVQEIILENNNGARHLWNFINKFDGKRKYYKGKHVFMILDQLGLDSVFDQLIAEQYKYKKERKQKQTKIKSLLFKLVHKIENF